MGKLYPWQASIDVSSLEPGDYTFVARTDDKRCIVGEPGAHRGLTTPMSLPGQAVVPCQPIEAELQHHLCRTRRPTSLAFNLLEPLEKTADVNQKTGKLRTNRIERCAQKCDAIAREWSPPLGVVCRNGDGAHEAPLRQLA